MNLSLTDVRMGPLAVELWGPRQRGCGLFREL